MRLEPRLDYVALMVNASKTNGTSTSAAVPANLTLNSLVPGRYDYFEYEDHTKVIFLTALVLGLCAEMFAKVAIVNYAKKNKVSERPINGLFFMEQVLKAVSYSCHKGAALF